MDIRREILGFASLLMLFSLSAAAQSDPFAGVSPSPAPSEQPGSDLAFFKDNFGFRREIMLEFVGSGDEPLYHRHSAGFEILKKFSSDTTTVAAFNFQGRLVYRDEFIPVLNDMEGHDRKGWTFEYHNAYADFYNVFDPLLSDTSKSQQMGRFNLRAGRFYLPFGLNLQTDTHGTVLQLSNEQNFGFERDWYAGLWGSASKNVNYDISYLAGSGYDLDFEGQSGLIAGRLSLGSPLSYEYGIEGGISGVTGERLGELDQKIETQRAGIDGRFRHSVPTGLATLTAELSGGKDENENVVMQLYQGDYLHASRRWGLSAQYRRFDHQSMAESSVIGEASWYFRNDVSNSNLHWVKLNVEKQREDLRTPDDIISTLQYYRYW